MESGGKYMEVLHFHGSNRSFHGSSLHKVVEFSMKAFVEASGLLPLSQRKLLPKTMEAPGGTAYVEAMEASMEVVESFLLNLPRKFS